MSNVSYRWFTVGFSGIIVFYERLIGKIDTLGVQLSLIDLILPTRGKVDLYAVEISPITDQHSTCFCLECMTQRAFTEFMNFLTEKHFKSP
jgi:hypothetical protein